MKVNIFSAILAAAAVTSSTPTIADSAAARCDIYPIGSDHVSQMIPCTFSQRHGWITIYSSDAKYDLEPVGDDPGNYKDQNDRRVYRESGLGDQGQIFRFEDHSIFVYWDTSALEPLTAYEDNPTAPFTTADYDATTLLSCRGVGDSGFGSCPAGILRMDGGQASIVIQNQAGEIFTINFMSNYVNSTNRKIEASLVNDTWTIIVDDGEIYEVPLAAIEGG